jgi:hypothetical protein
MAYSLPLLTLAGKGHTRVSDLRLLQAEVEKVKQDIATMELQISNELSTNPYSDNTYQTKQVPRDVTSSTSQMQTSRTVKSQMAFSTPSNQPKPTTPLLTSTPIIATAPTTSAQDSDIKRLADYLSLKSLPSIEPETFKGDPLEFPRWLTVFESIIEERPISSNQKLIYLAKYTTGEAKEAIQGYLSLRSPEAYDRAKNVLMERYGDKYLIYDAYKRKLMNWPVIKAHNSTELRKFSDFLNCCLTAMDSVRYLQILDDAEENRKLVSKLPQYIVDRWRRVVDGWLYGETTDCHGYPPFNVFCDFLKKEARIACCPVSYRDDRTDSHTQNHPQKHSTLTARTLQTQTCKPDAITRENRNCCVVCKATHSIINCPDFQKMSLQDKATLIKSKALCYGCLTYGHRKQDCYKKMACNKCGGRHPTVMHDDSRRSYKPTHHSDTQFNNHATTNAMSHCANCSEYDCVCLPEYFHSSIVPVKLYHVDNPQNVVTMYAMIDEQSDSCFVINDVLHDLNAPSVPVDVKLTTLTGENLIHCSKTSGLVVQGVGETTEIRLPGCYSRESIPVKSSQIPRPETIVKWPHLEKIASQILPYDESLKVGLLVGINCVRATRPKELITGKGDEPYALRTALGWGVIGNTCTNHDLRSQPMQHFAYRTLTTEVSPAQVDKLFNMGFEEKSGDKVSIEDGRFLQIVKDGIKYKDDGHFELPLPLKDDTHLPDNRMMADKRLQSLKRKMLLDPQFRMEYTGFMSDLINNRYAEIIPPDEKPSTGNVWYIPHHAVYHAKKKKMRIVFDCSAEFAGDSLNKHLMQGPDMINNLTGILCRFREERVAFVCDIEGMFHQVSVSREHRNYLRFLWWQNGEVDTEPIVHRMTAHLFGAKSSPGCVNFALKSAADKFEPEFGTEAANFVRENFYVDDGIKSVPSTEEAIQLIADTQGLCRKGGFNLHKIIANDKNVIKTVPPEDRAQDIQKMDIVSDDLPVERTLGVQWCIQSDCFQFQVELQDKPITRRGILSTVSSIFDPLGLVAPFVLLGKKILQSLCRDCASWDDPVSDDIRARWEKWRSEILALARLKIPRCYKSEDFGMVQSVELHHFCDASQIGLGQCSYLRLIDEKNNVCTSLVMAKARVGPSKPITIPRLELTAAVMSVRTSQYLDKELAYKNISHFYWTDSMIVIGYLSNDARRFHTFVANRVQLIREYTAPSDWRHVGTRENPADLASRGLDASLLMQNELWWKGPEFLQHADSLPKIREMVSLAQNDPEVKSITVLVSQTAIQREGLLPRLERFSSWNSARRAVAQCLRFFERLKNRQAKKPQIAMRPAGRKKNRLQNVSPVRVEDICEAERIIITHVQKQFFPLEIDVLRKLRDKDISNRKTARHRNQTLKGSSSLYRLDPFMSSDQLIRVGGRIRRANLPRDITQPVILPKECHITKLIIAHHHEKCAHSGRGITLNTLRASGYWIISGNSAVTSFIWKCVICRKLRGVPQSQKMADLPMDRLHPAPPFTYSAVDYFGHFTVKEGRRELKRYGVMFTCLSSRAVHIEVASDLSTDAFLNAYRRFVCRRGPVRMLRSDQGSNFIGAKSEQERAKAELDGGKIHTTLLKDGCDWITFNMNVPHASHMGGVWERMIRSARNALSALLIAHGDQLNDELLRTLLVEAECIINSRPLTYVDTSSADSPIPLSPNQILTLKTKAVMPPPGKFVRQDVYCHRRWRRVQYLADEFWRRWKLEFLPTLQQRKKWTKSQKNVAAGDVVLMMDDNLSRNKWPLARVLETNKGKDGLVRTVTLKHGNSTYDRPIHKLILLLDCGSTN